MARLKIALIVALIAAFAGAAWIFVPVGAEFASIEQDEQTSGPTGSAGAESIFDFFLRPAWRTIGHDPANTRSQPFEHRISTRTVHRLAPKWVATTTGDVSATPAVVNGAVYFGDFGGTVWKLNAKTGAVIWSHSVPDYTGNAGDLVRTSPSLAGNTLVVGVIKGSTTVPGPNMLGIDAATGALRWKTQIHPDPHAAMTGSPVLVGNVVITGVSANGASGGPGGATATFRGAIVALDAQTGNILWRTYSVPDNGGVPGGYAGATMFSPPAVDLVEGLVYGTFGQPYHVPDSVTACHQAQDAGAGGFAESCEAPGAFWKSIVAFDLRTGEPRWSYRLNRSHGLCAAQPAGVTWCAPDSDAEKWDLGGSGANVIRSVVHGRLRSAVGVGAKSGAYTLFDAKKGTVIWSTLVGPGGDQGGVEWGTAFDGQRIYVPITNHHHIPYELTQHGRLTTETTTGGSWAALDPITGKILWQTADPQTEVITGFTGPVGVWDLAPVTVANGVLFGGSMAKRTETNPAPKQMLALDARTGAILWTFTAGATTTPASGSVNAGPAVVNGSVYWGSGYSRSGVEGSGNNKFFAFSLDGQ